MNAHNPSPSTLEQWNAQLNAVLSRQQLALSRASTDRAETAQKLAGKSGLEAMSLMLQGELTGPRISETMDFYLVEVGEGLAVFQGTPSAKHFNPMGTVHGGWYATLLDSALGCCVHTRLPPGKAYTTSQLNVNIVRAANEKTGPLRAIGQVVHMGRQVATSEAKLVDAEGRLYAHATSTCFVFDAR